LANLKELQRKRKLEVKTEVADKGEAKETAKKGKGEAIHALSEQKYETLAAAITSVKSGAAVSNFSEPHDFQIVSINSQSYTERVCVECSQPLNKAKSTTKLAICWKGHQSARVRQVFGLYISVSDMKSLTEAVHDVKMSHDAVMALFPDWNVNMFDATDSETIQMFFENFIGLQFRAKVYIWINPYSPSKFSVTVKAAEYLGIGKKDVQPPQALEIVA